MTHIFVLKVNKDTEIKPLKIGKAIEIDDNDSGFCVNFIVTNDQHVLMFASKNGILTFNCSTSEVQWKYNPDPLAFEITM